MFEVRRPDGLTVHQGTQADCKAYVRNVQSIWGIKNLRIVRKGK
jgi:hypothetical protein